MNYRLLSFESGEGPRAGLLVEGQVYDLARIAGDERLATVLAVLADWGQNEPLLGHLAAQLGNSVGMPIDSVSLLAPILYPPTIYCAGANYADHVENMERKLGLPRSPDPRDAGGKPYHFLKASRCCVGNGAAVRAPSARLDWEGELVVVIGREGRDIPVGRAMELVAGYMIGNDLSARDIAFKANFPPPSIFNHSFLEHKSFEHAAPVGPWITPASMIDDFSRLTIRTTVNGELKQDGACGGMTFSIAEQLSYLSSISTLVPGDIVMTGTPAGVGIETGEFLAPGDVVTIGIEGLGNLTTAII
jgi:2-keto-4-pentenoate hydratase/2-oxohepta-3-ene-1,7-dioic acid hydratase in catechol pathway